MQTLFDAVNLASVPVPWLDALPQGPDFAAPRIQGQGQPVTGPFSRLALVGQVYFERGGGGVAMQSFVLEADGRLATVSATQAQLLEREPGEPGPQQISPAMATSDQAGTAVPDNGLPAKSRGSLPCRHRCAWCTGPAEPPDHRRRRDSRRRAAGWHATTG